MGQWGLGTAGLAGTVGPADSGGPAGSGGLAGSVDLADSGGPGVLVVCDQGQKGSAVLTRDGPEPPAGVGSRVLRCRGGVQVSTGQQAAAPQLQPRYPGT